MIKIITALVLTALCLSPALAADAMALYKKHNCHTCHGEDGDTPIAPNYPKLMGQNAEYALTQMKDIKSGKRANGLSAAMKALMITVPEKDMKTISKWFESAGKKK